MNVLNKEKENHHRKSINLNESNRLYLVDKVEEKKK
jgi:hypothetical protein